MSVVYVRTSCGLGDGSGNLRRGDAWDSESDVVKQYPHLFEAEPAKVKGRVRGRVERATRAPGEKRGGPKAGTGGTG